MVKKIELKYKYSVKQDRVRSSDLRKAYEMFLADSFGATEIQDLYRYAGLDTVTTYTTLKRKNKKTKEVKPLILEKEYVVELGGPFEQIGEEDNILGGGKQKIGSNK